ncbi:hypothetical protein C8J57DRAFT_1571489 [Mycena rebaudengoi]|nr:hypothetical protein C8J57DRAFT_1571489 [Mycena rebaudengoi]
MSDLLSYRTCAIAVPPSEQNSNVSKQTIIGAIGGKTTTSASFSVVTKLDQLWDSGATLTYSLPYANISFQRASLGMLRISFNDKLGSWSYVGTVNMQIPTSEATMNLGWIADTNVISDDERGVVLHEFGHVLGLESPARSGKIHLNEDAVYAYYGPTQRWDRPTIKSQIIDVYNSNDVSNYSVLDTTSVMMYFMPHQMNVEQIDIPPNDALSDLDKAYMVINYPRPSPHATAPQWTLDYALKVSGVDATTTQDIKNSKADIDKVRALFTTFQVDQRAKAAPPSNGANPDEGETSEDETGDEAEHGDKPPVVPTWCPTVDPMESDSGSPASGPDHGVSDGEDILWIPYTTITYGFMSGTDDDTAVTDWRKERVEKALQLYAENSSLKFAFVDITGWDFAKKNTRSRCKMRIAFGKPVDTGTTTVWGWSYHGRNAEKFQFDPLAQKDRPGPKFTTMFLGGQPKDSAAELALDSVKLQRANQTVYHELGHALGLVHEHESPRTETNPLLSGKTVVDYLMATTFDPKSVMLYSGIKYAWNVDPFKETSANTYPSGTDLDLIQLMYPDSGDRGGKFATSLAEFDFNASEITINLALATAALKTGGNTDELSVLRNSIAASINNRPRLSKRIALAPSNGASPPAPPAPSGDPPATWCAWQPPSGAASDSPDGVEHGVVVEKTLWPPKTIMTYGFFAGTDAESAATDFRKDRVTEVLKLYMQNSSLTFNRLEDDMGKRDLSTATGRQMCRIRIAFGPPALNPTTGRYVWGWSFHGTEADTKVFDPVKNNPDGRPGPMYATVYLGGQPKSFDQKLTVEELDMANQTLTHELGHMLGLYHEHLSPLSETDPNESQGETIAGVMVATLFDPDSVMLYRNIPLKGNGGPDPTKKTKMNTYPSGTDLDLIQLLYPDSGEPIGKGKFADALDRFKFGDQIPDLLTEATAALKRYGYSPELTKLRTSIALNLNGVPRLSTRVATAIDWPVSTPPPPPPPLPLDTATWCGFTGYSDDSEPFEIPDWAKTEAVEHGVVVEKTLFPPNTTITYGFMPDTDALGKVDPIRAATDHRKDRVAKALQVYMDNSSLKFQLQDGDISKFNLSTAIGRSLCKIRIAFGDPVLAPKGGKLWGWSLLGQDALTGIFDPATDTEQRPGPKYATIYLGGQPQTIEDRDKLTPDELAMANRTLFHELGHTLGLYHEHQSPNRETDPRRSGDMITDVLTATLFDPDSVMLYANIPFDWDHDPFETTKLNPFPSATDLDLIQLMYPDTGEPTGKFAKSLAAFRFDASDIATLLTQAQSALKKGGNNSELTALRFAIASNINGKPRLSIRAPSSGVEPSGPTHDAGPPGGADGAPAASTSQVPGFLMQLVDALKQFFNPGGNQIFTLQFPGRFLDQASYAWDTQLAGIYGQFIKPTAVNEAEFRLVDQLYDLAPNVGGPNGTNLSIVYEQLLNNLLPKYVENGLAKQQDQIRQWLMKDVPMSQWIRDIMARQKAREAALANAVAVGMGEKSAPDEETDPATPTPSNMPARGIMFDVSSKGSSETLNRIELSELLMNEYLYAKQDWEIERDALISQASQADVGSPESQKALNELTRKLAHITATRQAQLAAKYSDAVVRGYSHTVREYMGYLDIASPAEALQNAKDSLREAAMSSLDGSMKVYPVQMTPLDWFQGLSTSFTMEDLTQDPEIIRTQINAKSRQLDTLNAQLVALQMGAKGDPAALQNKVEAAQTALDSAQSTLSQTYSNNIISMANTCLDAVGKVDIATLAGKIGVAQSVLSQLPAQMDAVKSAQDNLTSSSRALSQMMAAQALAEATDTKQQQQQLTLQIQSLTGDLKELQTRWQVLTASTGGVAPPVTVDQSDVRIDPTLPVQLPQESSSGGSRWQSITLTSSKSSRTDIAKSFSDATSEQWSCNLWIASGSGSSSSSSAASTTSTTATDDTIDLAFRATLVTVDRGGWFQPQFFKESKAFYKVNGDISWVDDKPNKVNGLMPGFPVAFLIAKDIVVRVTHSDTNSTNSKSSDAASSASSGGFLCFSYSKSSSSNSTATASNFRAFSNGYIIKIPGPQILGYMIEKTDSDDAHLMPAELPADFFIPDDDYNKGVNGDPAHGANPADGAHPPEGNTAITQDQLQKALSKMLDDKVGELFNALKTDNGSSSSQTSAS